MSINGDFEINDEYLNDLLEQQVNQSISKDSSLNISINSIKIEKNDMLKKCFRNLNFYVEIYNNTIDQSDILDEMIKSNGGNVKLNF